MSQLCQNWSCTKRTSKILKKSTAPVHNEQKLKLHIISAHSLCGFCSSSSNARFFFLSTCVINILCSRSKWGLSWLLLFGEVVSPSSSPSQALRPNVYPTEEPGIGPTCWQALFALITRIGKSESGLLVKWHQIPTGLKPRRPDILPPPTKHTLFFSGVLFFQAALKLMVGSVALIRTIILSRMSWFGRSLRWLEQFVACQTQTNKGEWTNNHTY